MSDTASKPLVMRILELESRAGRIEGLFAADPEIARMWRAQAALTEACRSVGLEDIHVFEGDVIHRHLENRLTDAEGARGAAAVAELLRFIAAPGSLTKDPEATLTRCWRSAVTFQTDGTELDPADLARRLRDAVMRGPTPFLAALRAAIEHRMMTDGRSPSADRLIFMAADHALRGGGHAADLSPDHPEALLRRLNAAWIFTPSIALTQGRFRAWSPGSPQGHLDLMDGISAELDRTLGAVPILRRWREEARGRAGTRHGKSRLRDLVELAIREPILTAAHIRNVLGVSDRASLYLMREAEEEGILTLITPRRSYRVWATPLLAQTLRMRAPRMAVGQGGVDGVGPSTKEDMTQAVDAPARDRTDMDFEERSAAALAELDEAMAHADAVLARYRRVEG